MKFFVVCAVFFASTLAEPPVDNRYLPPQQGAAPAQIYGAPSFGAFGKTGALIRNRPNFISSRPISQRLSSQYLPPQTPSRQYGTPLSTPLSQYGTPQFTSSQGLPSPSSQYGAPQAGFHRQSLTPSALYGTPGFNGAVNTALQSRQYLPPGVGAYNGDNGNNEPANYSFEYMVKDDQSGNDFGHRESRLGDRAEGLYYVVLPDGRKQTVEYEADQDGYKPRISYEQTGSGYSRYGQAGGYVNGGYTHGY